MLGFGPYPSTVLFHYLLANRQPESGPTSDLLGMRKLFELVKEPRQVLLGDSDAGIGDGNHHRIFQDVKIGANRCKNLTL